MLLLNESQTSEFISELKEVLNGALPDNFIKVVDTWNGSFGGRYIKVAFMPTDYEINNVRGQYPLLSSFSIDLETLKF